MNPAQRPPIVEPGVALQRGQLWPYSNAGILAIGTAAASISATNCTAQVFTASSGTYSTSITTNSGTCPPLRRIVIQSTDAAGGTQRSHYRFGTTANTPPAATTTGNVFVRAGEDKVFDLPQDNNAQPVVSMIATAGGANVIVNFET